MNPTQWTEESNDSWKTTQQSGDLQPNNYLDQFRRHWRLIAAVATAGVVCGVLHYFLTPKQYHSSTTLQIERRSLTALTSDNNPWLDSYFNMEFYPTQYRLLQSRGLAERVVIDLDLGNDSEFAPLQDQGEGGHRTDDEIVLGNLANRLLAGLEVTPVRSTQLVEISYRSPNPGLAAKVANGVADAFIDWGINTRSETAANASTFLTTQIEQLNRSLEEKEEELQSYSRSTDIVAIDPQSNDTLQRLEGLNRDFVAATSDRITSEAYYQGLVNSDRQAVADSVSGGLISQQLEEIGRLDTSYNGKLKTYKPDWPEMVELKAQIEQRQKTLTESVDSMAEQALSRARSEYTTALRKEQSLKRELDSQRGQAMELNSVAVEYNNLALEVTAKKSLISDLSKRQSETELASRMNSSRESNVRIVDRALVPARPFRPSLRNDLTFGLSAGLLLGIALAMLIEYLDRSIKTSSQLEKLLEIPTLAVIPDISEGQRYGYGYGYGGRHREAKRRTRVSAGETSTDRKGSRKIELLPIEQPKIAVSEAYRALRTALLLSTANELKVVALTSANAGEGKTATSANLAVVMAQLGKRVLLIDGDLRKPRLHQVFEMSNRVGLVNCLTEGVDPRTVFGATGLPSLFVAPSGPIPPNPSELLASARMKELLAYCSKHFDFVIVDTPPTLAVTDSTLIGSLVDGVVLCLQAGRVLREEASTCLERLQLADVRILGTVLNRYRTSSSKSDSGYLYQQAYAYASDEKSTHSAA